MRPREGCHVPPIGRWLVASVLGAAGAAQAVDFPGPLRWDGTLTLANDSVHRGITWSDGRAVAAVEVGASTDQDWNASVGVETPSYPEYGGRAGLTLAAAKAWQLDAEWRGQASLTRYAFTGRSEVREAGYTEFGLTFGWQGRAFLNVAVSPDRRWRDAAAGDIRSARAAAVELGVTQRLAGSVALDAGIGGTGITSAGRSRGYRYASIGIRWSVGPMQAQLGGVASDAERRGAAPPGKAGPRALAQLGWRF